MEMDIPNISVSKSSTFGNYENNENKNVQQSFCAQPSTGLGMTFSTGSPLKIH